jgi:hypothetical protein
MRTLQYRPFMGLCMDYPPFDLDYFNDKEKSIKLIFID